jgi:hypothetical protein
VRAGKGRDGGKPRTIPANAELRRRRTTSLYRRLDRDVREPLLPTWLKLDDMHRPLGVDGLGSRCTPFVVLTIDGFGGPPQLRRSKSSALDIDGHGA